MAADSSSDRPDKPDQPDSPAKEDTAIAVEGVTCRRCGSRSQQKLHEAPRLTLFKCDDCGWRYALSR